MNYKAFSALIVVTLLIIYSVVIGWVIYDLLTLSIEEFETPSKQAITIITTIGGLISALVLAKLATTTPGDIPSFSMGEPKATTTVEKSLTSIYLLIWFVVGLGCLVVGTFINDHVSLLNDIGTTWFGIAVAAAYAYFGITPNTR